MDPQGYLTGFPLGEEGAYALIRTWPAPEVERPGSVWSHVLLIDFSELARVTESWHTEHMFSST